MNSPLSDQDVQQLYEAFSADHGLLREQLLARLKERAPEQTHRNAAPPAAWTRLRRSHHFVRRTAIVAGGMLAAIGLWLAIPLSTPAPVFGLEGLPERLVEVRSIHLRGKSHFSRRPGQETAPPPAVQEIYVARPFQSLRIHSENAAEGVRQIREVRDGKQRMKIDDLAKRVTLGKDLQTAAEYSVETFLQRGLFQQVLGSATTAGFAKLSTEAIDGVTQVAVTPMNVKVTPRLRHVIRMPIGFYHAEVWKTPLLGHEFDHVAVSLDPRPRALLVHLCSNLPVYRFAQEGEGKPSSEQMRAGIDRELQRRQEAILELLQANYMALDKASTNGREAMQARSDFFESLYTRENLAATAFPFLEEVASILESDAYKRLHSRHVPADPFTLPQR